MKITVAKYYTPSGRCIQKLDYSNKNKNGRAEEIPDSLITEFKTLNSKRPVFDGKGIKPDIAVKGRLLSDIAAVLIIKNHIFDFATEYRLKYESIASAKEFVLTDDEYEDFVHFLEDKDYEYTTESEDILEELQKAAKEDKYFAELEKEYEALKSKLYHNKKDDLYKFKDEIKLIIENEIVSRYHYQKGQVEVSMKDDPTLSKASEMLIDTALYNSVLDGTYKGN